MGSWNRASKLNPTHPTPLNPKPYTLNRHNLQLRSPMQRLKNLSSRAEGHKQRLLQPHVEKSRKVVCS